MFVPFDKISDRARVWIYAVNRQFNSQELEAISKTLLSFVEGWQVHGSPMQASFDIKFNRFVILAADEQVNAASGCSIDDAVRTFKKLGMDLNVDFFDRTLVNFKVGREILPVPLSDVKSKLQEGVWNQDTPVFNNLIETKKDLNEKWLAPAGSTWLKRYLPQHSVIG